MIASGAITLESSRSDAIMHRMKTEGQACKLSKASLLSALEKSHEESISHHEEAASAARALESVEERNHRLLLKNHELVDCVRGARAEVREQKSARRRSDALAEDMQQQLHLMKDLLEEELGKRVIAVEVEEMVSQLFMLACLI